MSALAKRLAKYNLTTLDLLGKLKIVDGETVFAYTSHLEGLGTEESDVDLYVLSKSIRDKPFVRDCGRRKIDAAIMNNLALDIEYWNSGDVVGIIEGISHNHPTDDIEQLKLLHRIRMSEIIYHDDLGIRIKSAIEQSALQRKIMELYLFCSNSDLADAINLYHSQEYISALYCARHSLENAIGAFNAKHGITNLKNKWVSKLFLRNFRQETDMYHQYLRLQIYVQITETNIATHVEEMIEFIQNILSQVAISTEDL